MVLAAGLGTRMQPITKTIPKPLVKVRNKALIDHALDRLVEVGVIKVVINLHYMAESVRNHLKDRKDLEIVFSAENERLETGGGVLKALDLLGSLPFFVVNSDSLWLNGPTPALGRLASEQFFDDLDGILLLHSTVDAYGYEGIGDFIAEPNGALARRPERQVSPWLFTGIQILHPRIFENGPNGCFSLNLLYDKAIANGKLSGIIHDGEWFHIGTPPALEEAEFYLNQRYAGRKHR